ncbi:serine/threonine protein kinase [Catenulispora sp. GP43]|uniref:serine/threonine-protein kinase n=1 Tax=Catenulispora sp. GP43 TaxID=3156263 RepID=UPI0035167C06
MEPLLPADPRKIARFQLLARLGSGGMGEVFLALTPDGRQVAVKIVRGGFDSGEAMARFRHEVEAVGRVRSRWTAALEDADLTGRPIWLATEYVPGPTLAAAVARFGAMPPGAVRHLAAGLAAAVADVHAQGVLHRDLKPNNVVLSPSGPRLIDFGIARTGDQTALTRTGSAVGTPGYLAPEIVRGGVPSPAADVFALGAMLAYAATGRPPFGVGDPHAIMFRSVEDPADTVGVEPSLADLITRYTAKDPTARPSAAELLAEVDGQASADDAPIVAGFYESLAAIADTAPQDVPTATEMGLLPPTASDAEAAPRRARKRTTTLVSAISAVAVVAVALAVEYFPNASDHTPHGASGLPSTPTAGGSPAAIKISSTSGTTTTAGGTTGTTTAVGTTTTAGTASTTTPSSTSTAPPTTFLRDRPGTQGVETSIVWNPRTHQCENSPAREEALPDSFGFQSSVDRQPIASGAPATVGFRSKNPNPGAPYYMAAEVLPPPSFNGNAVVYRWNDKAQPIGTDWAYTTFPKDFTPTLSAPGAGNLPAGTDYAGNYVILWFHVHSDGEAYYVSCDGFSVS